MASHLEQAVAERGGCGQAAEAGQRAGHAPRARSNAAMGERSAAQPGCVMCQLVQHYRRRTQSRCPQSSTALRGRNGRQAVGTLIMALTQSSACRQGNTAHLGGAVQTAAPSSLSRSLLTVHRAEGSHPPARSDGAPEQQSQGARGWRPQCRLVLDDQHGSLASLPEYLGRFPG